MTIPLYTKIPRGERIFDGNAARKHLENHLAMRLVKPIEIPELLIAFKNWYHSCQDFIITPDEEVSILIPPTWY